MDENFAQLKNIAALLDFGVDTKTFQPWFSFAALTQLLTLHVNGLVYMGFSRAWSERFSNDSNVMEVRCECRHLSTDELGKYVYQVDSPEAMPRLTVITVHGDLNLEIICDSFKITLEPLSQKFPDMV